MRLLKTTIRSKNSIVENDLATMHNKKRACEARINRVAGFACSGFVEIWFFLSERDQHYIHAGKPYSFAATKP